MLRKLELYLSVSIPPSWFFWCWNAFESNKKGETKPHFRVKLKKQTKTNSFMEPTQLKTSQPFTSQNVIFFGYGVDPWKKPKGCCRRRVDHHPLPLPRCHDLTGFFLDGQYVSFFQVYWMIILFVRDGSALQLTWKAAFDPNGCARVARSVTLWRMRFGVFSSRPFERGSCTGCFNFEIKLRTSW